MGQELTPYLDALREHALTGPANYNVPAHKAGIVAPLRLASALGQRALALDIPPLIHGIDTGIDPAPLEEAQRLAAEAWGAERTWFLHNGASQANQAVCLTLAQRGRRVVVQRTVHSSTIDGLVLAGLEPVFVAPELDPDRGIAHCVTPAALGAAFERAGDVAGLVVVSPTYFGMAADLGGLVDAAHDRGIPIAVDEAWGSHFAFHRDLPHDAVGAGADLVVSSTHKMLGSLTQSAMLHLGSSTLLAPEAIERALRLTQTTSPSALLAGSLDAARHRAVTHGAELLGRTLTAAAALREQVRAVDGLDVLDDRLVGRFGIAGVDPLRVAIDLRAAGVDGYEVQRALRRAAGVFVELAAPTVIVAIVGMGEDGEAGRRLVDGLGHALAATPRRRGRALPAPPPFGPLVVAPREAFLGATERVPFAEAEGRVAAETLAVYPPGIPNVMPGERVTGELSGYLAEMAAGGAVIRGSGERRLETLRVVGDAERRGR